MSAIGRGSLFLFVSLMTVSVTCAAQSKDQIRDQAKTLAAKFRQAGEPKDRCSLEATVADGAIITSVSADVPLQPGDRLQALNQTNVSGQSGDFVINLLRGLSPDATVDVTLDRNGDRLNVSVPCTNARQRSDVLLAGLDAASRGKFDECVSAFNRRNDLGAFGAGMKLMCASATRNPNQSYLAGLSLDAANAAISEAHWSANARPGVIEGLRQMQGVITRHLGEAKFQELVAATERWPGGSDMFKSTEPDVENFRRVAEQVLRSRLIDPDSARIEWPYGFLNGSWKPAFQKPIEGYWTCGLINAKNRMGGYTGSHAFVVVVSPTGLVQYVEMGTGKDFDILSSQCANSARLLPPAPPGFGSDAGGGRQQAAPSMADELKKLADLRQSGALTEAEFQAAKQRLLSAPANP
ncbi:MAG: PDZ domain-containing protein [Stenotrophomonas sp.]|nr:PDZ domain-containing protein [Stenotrophomonas sp.]